HRAHRPDPRRPRPVDLAGDADRAVGQASRRRIEARLTGNLYLDASDAVVLLTPLPMVIAANAAVGKAWAHHATGILCGLLAGSMFLFGAIDYATGGGGRD